MKKKATNPPHLFRVGDDAACIGSTETYYGKITDVTPMRVCIQLERSRVWFQRKQNRWVGVMRNDLSLAPRQPDWIRR